MEQVNYFVVNMFSKESTIDIFQKLLRIGAPLCFENEKLQSTFLLWKQYCIQNPIWSMIQDSSSIVYYGVKYAIEIASFTIDEPMCLRIVNYDDVQRLTTLIVDDNLYSFLQSILV